MLVDAPNRSSLQLAAIELLSLGHLPLYVRCLVRQIGPTVHGHFERVLAAVHRGSVLLDALRVEPYLNPFQAEVSGSGAKLAVDGVEHPPMSASDSSGIGANSKCGRFRMSERPAPIGVPPGNEDSPLRTKSPCANVFLLFRKVSQRVVVPTTLSQAVARAAARALAMLARVSSSIASKVRQAVGLEATSPNNLGWFRGTARSEIASPPLVTMTAKSTSTSPRSCPWRRHFVGAIASDLRGHL